MEDSAVPATPGTSIEETGDGWLTRRAVIRNNRGLHARAAAKFVKLAETFRAQVEVAKGGQAVAGRSIMGLMMLAAAPGTCIEIRARGPDADSALEALGALVDGKFNED